MFSLLAGAISGMFGIGGGIINGPLLLEMGFDPSAASAMTATTVLFASGSIRLCSSLVEVRLHASVLNVVVAVLFADDLSV